MRLLTCTLVVALVACGGGNSAGPQSHTLTVQISGNGKVTSSPAGIDCGSTCGGTFSQAVTLTATAGAGAAFAGWDGACSGTGACTVPMSADATVKATFQTTLPPTQRVHTLNVTVRGSGRVLSTPSGLDCRADCSAQFAEDTSVALDVQTDAGWSFSGWSGACSGAQGCSVLMSADRSVGAEFQQIPATNECDGLLPASLPTPVVASLPQNNCFGGTSDDGIGNYALGYTAEDSVGHGHRAWRFFTIQQGSAIRIGDDVVVGDDVGAFVESQPSGFTLSQVVAASGAAFVSWYSHDGTRGASSTLTTSFMGGDYAYSAVGVDPSGGLAAVRTYKSSGEWVSEYQRFDKFGAVESSWVRIDSGVALHQVVAVGVPLSGHALVLEAISYPSSMQGRWLDRAGTPLTDWFPVAGAQFPEFHFLMDGGLVLRFGRDSDYVYRFDDGKAAVSPLLPAWLQQRSGNQFFVIRGGKGYASWGTQGSCPGQMEVLAASSGKSCGCVAVPGLARTASIGRDGSLIVPPQGSCQYNLYPQLLQ
jgi:hypothetical protein